MSGNTMFVSNSILYLIIVGILTFYICIISYEIRKKRRVKQLFLRHMHEGVLLFSEDLNNKSPYLISIFLGMYINKITYREFYKYAKIYLRNVPVFLFNVHNKEALDMKIGFSKPHKGKMTFYFFNSEDGEISRYTVRADDYCDTRFLKWADKMTQFK